MQYFSKIKRETLDYTTHRSELDNVKYVSMDLHEPYKDIASSYFPKAQVCADSFHDIKNLTTSFREVLLRCRRRTENESLQYLLSKFRFVFRHKIILDKEPKYI